jgi:hypothetical protein
MFLADACYSRRAPGSGDGARGLWAEPRRPLGLGAPLVPPPHPLGGADSGAGPGRPCAARDRESR